MNKILLFIYWTLVSTCCWSEGDLRVSGIAIRDDFPQVVSKFGYPEKWNRLDTSRPLWRATWPNQTVTFEGTYRGLVVVGLQGDSLELDNIAIDSKSDASEVQKLVSLLNRIRSFVRPAIGKQKASLIDGNNITDVFRIPLRYIKSDDDLKSDYALEITLSENSLRNVTLSCEPEPEQSGSYLNWHIEEQLQIEGKTFFGTF